MALIKSLADWICCVVKTVWIKYHLESGLFGLFFLTYVFLGEHGSLTCLSSQWSSYSSGSSSFSVVGEFRDPSPLSLSSSSSESSNSDLLNLLISSGSKISSGWVKNCFPIFRKINKIK